jgi:hypothetical protein
VQNVLYSGNHDSRRAANALNSCHLETALAMESALLCCSGVTLPILYLLRKSDFHQIIRTFISEAGWLAQ